ncbi:MAG: DNA polymerase V UmuC [Pelagibacteraceae bacterium TMED216]|nr:MAG: DNA polymerase V UmuC [Pelagibacteraceae bacterium TMED216]
MSSIKYTTKKNKIALIDCNSFYVSCERLFKPKIEKRAVVVLSNNDGCVISRSQEAKDIGIKMGEPYFKVKKLITRNKIEVYSSNYALYGDISRRVMKILKTFSPKVEIYSIDEAFIDLSFMDDKGIEEYGRQIRSRVLKWTGIPTSVGISSTKTLSKVANHIAKKEKAGVVYLKKNIDEKLKKFPIENVWGVGKQLSKFYYKNNICNAYDLKNASNTWVKKGTNVLGAKTAMELRGIPCINLQVEQEKRKNCCVSRSFGRKVKNIEELEESVVTHCLNAAEKIRAEDQTAKTITVFIRTSPFDKTKKYYSNSKTIDLAIPSSNSIELIKNAVKALNDIYKYGYSYQKAGIILSNLKDAKQNDHNLLTPLLENKSKKLMRAIDYTNSKYGRYAISIAQAGLSKGWKMRREHSSKIDTASFDSLPIIGV